MAHNRARGVVTPWIARTIHRNRRDGRKFHRYHKLDADGVLLTLELRMTWATEIVNSIYKNTKQMPSY